MRAIASEMNLVTADKKDSQGLCFVGKIKLPDFLQQQLKSKEGSVIEIPKDLHQFKEYHALSKEVKNIEKLCTPFEYKKTDGIEVSKHLGAHFYTIGQRKGLHIGGRPEASFVIATDTIENTVYSGQTDAHPGLNRIALKIKPNSINWISQKAKVSQLDYGFKIRYRQPLQNGRLIQKNGSFYVLFEEKQKGISPGQFVAWYKEGALIGSGVIEN